VSSGDPCSDDGLYCNGIEICDENSDACVSSDDPCLDDGVFCNGIEICDEETNTCESEGNPCESLDLLCDEESDACVGCLEDGDCDDELYCTGDETCVSGECVSSGDPCTDDGVYCTGTEICDEETDACMSSGDPCSDDGLYCNGTESCDEEGDQCEHSGDPCSDDGLYCNGREICDENSDACVSSDDPCLDDGAFCNGVESCDEDADECVSSGHPCGEDEICIEEDNACEPGIIEATFEGCGRAFLPGFGMVTIQGTGTNFGLLSTVEYDSLEVVKGLKATNTAEQTITQVILLLPSFDPFLPVLLPAYPNTVTVTVNDLSDTFLIPACREEQEPVL
jgi:hypothetical protein